MKKEEVEHYLGRLPIKLWAKDGTVITVCNLIKRSDSSISIKDKFDTNWTIEFSDISKIQELNSHSHSKTAKNGGGFL